MAEFGVNSRAQDVLAGLDLQGIQVLLTGVSAGLGVETARALVAQGAKVTGTARDIAKAKNATNHIREAAKSSGGEFNLIELDLASLASIRACSSRLIKKNENFNVVIANAGVMATPFNRTADNFEMQFGTNHLGHFLLINRLASLISNNGRLVVLSSAGHRQSDIDLNDPNFERTEYDPWTSYGRSKTANVLFSVEFDRRHRHRGVRACAVMPGVIDTELGRHMTKDQLHAIMASMKEASELAGTPAFDFKTVEQGTATTVWAALVADANTVGGRYCENCNIAEIIDAEEIPSGVRSYALDEANAKKLWMKSEELVGEYF